MLLKNGVFDQLRRVGLRKHELSQNPTFEELAKPHMQLA